MSLSYGLSLQRPFHPLVQGFCSCLTEPTRWPSPSARRASSVLSDHTSHATYATSTHLFSHFCYPSFLKSVALARTDDGWQKIANSEGASETNFNTSGSMHGYTYLILNPRLSLLSRESWSRVICPQYINVTSPVVCTSTRW